MGSGSGIGVGSGAGVRITTGMVETGRAGDGIGRGGTLGIGTGLGSGTAVGNCGRRLATGAATEGRGSVGAAAGEAVAGSVGMGTAVGIAGRAVVAASGVRVAPVHAADATSARTSSGRITNSPRPIGQVTGQPIAQDRKQAVAAVQSASVRLPGLSRLPRLFPMRFALIPPMPIAPMPGLASRSGG